MNFLLKVILVILCVACTGCASIVSKSHYPVLITTEPSEAKIEVKDQDGVIQFAGTSPATAILKAGKGYFTRASYTVTASKEGYNTAALPLRTSVDGWYWGNFLFGGLIGFLIVDPVTGAMFKVNDPKGPIALTEASPPVSNHGERLIKLRELREQGILSEAEYQSKKKAIVSEM